MAVQVTTLDDEREHGSTVLLVDELGSAGVPAFPKGTRRFPSRGTSNR
jgi:hypothetical protein